jgi:hypothetical protein
LNSLVIGHIGGKEKAMSIGQAYTDILTPPALQALQGGCDTLIDGVFDDLENVKDPQDFADTWVAIYLPERYLYKYTPLFLRQFAVCIITVAWKLAQPEHMPLSSLAEELAANAIIESAKAYAEVIEEIGDVDEIFEDFIGMYFEDTDFLFLFDDAYDGIDETEVGEVMGISSLAFDDWFKPFSDEPSRIGHPYVV